MTQKSDSDVPASSKTSRKLHAQGSSDAMREEDLQPPEFNPAIGRNEDVGDELSPPEFEPELRFEGTVPEPSVDTGIQWSPTEAAHNSRNWTYLALIGFTCFFICLASWLSYIAIAIAQYKENTSQQVNIATQKASMLVQQLETEFLEPAERLVQQMQALVEHNEGDMDRFHRLVKNTSQRLKPLSFGVAYEPFAYDKNIKLKAPFFRRMDNGEYVKLDAGAVYDYTRPPGPTEHYDSRWYTETIHTEGGWQEPALGSILQTWYAEYSLPIYRTNAASGKKEKVGIVFADFSLSTVREMVRRITLDDLAYGYLVSPSQTIVSHPVASLLGKPLTHAYATQIQDGLVTTQSTMGQHIIEKVAAGENFVLELLDEVTGQTSLVVHRRVLESNWSFAIVMPVESVFTINQHYQRSLLFAAVAIAIALILTIITLRYQDMAHERLPWLIGLLISLGGLFTMVFIISLFGNQSSSHTRTKMFSEAEILAARGNTQSNEKVIPTGILIKNLGFPNPDTATVSGIVWQKFTNSPDSEPMMAATDTPAGIE